MAPLAVVLDSFLQPFVLKLPQSLKDTKHFINLYENLPFPEDAILMTLDVNALYTSIPHEGVRNIVSRILDSREDKTLPTYFLMELLDLVLDKNYFKFGSDFFMQIKGVAMGSPVAPSIANLFMAHLEELFILNPVTNPFSRISYTTIISLII